MRKYLLFCLAFCVLGCLAQDLIVRPNDPVIYKKGGAFFMAAGDTAWELFHVLIRRRSFIIWITARKGLYGNTGCYLI